MEISKDRLYTYVNVSDRDAIRDVLTYGLRANDNGEDNGVWFSWGHSFYGDTYRRGGILLSMAATEENAERCKMYKYDFENHSSVIVAHCDVPIEMLTVESCNAVEVEYPNGRVAYIPVERGGSALDRISYEEVKGWTKSFSYTIYKDVYEMVVGEPMEGADEISLLPNMRVINILGGGVGEARRITERGIIRLVENIARRFLTESGGHVCKCYLMVGMPGSGKSTWCRTNLPSLPFVSRDVVRYKLGYTKSVDDKARLSWEEEVKVAEEEYRIIDGFIEDGQDFIIDYTNIGRFRKPLIDRLHSKGVYVIGVNVDTPIDTCIERRKGQISAEVMRGIYGSMIPLEDGECDEVINV